MRAAQNKSLLLFFANLMHEVTMSILVHISSVKALEF